MATRIKRPSLSYCVATVPYPANAETGFPRSNKYASQLKFCFQVLLFARKERKKKSSFFLRCQTKVSSGGAKLVGPLCSCRFMTLSNVAFFNMKQRTKL